jgi:antitoxin component YwqK of YwqJK toxin-antitoxin module
MIILIALFTLLTAPLADNGESVLMKDMNYIDGMYYHKDRIFNGDIIDYYENESLKFRYNVLDGRIHGLAKEYYASGALKSEKNYILSKLYGNFTAYFETGEIRIQFDVKLHAYQKGEIIEKLIIGQVKKGRHKTKTFDEGIIYFLDETGTEFSNSEEISILQQSRFKIMDTEMKKILFTFH